MRGSGPSGDNKLERWGMAFVSALDLQLLLGLLVHLGLNLTMAEIGELRPVDERSRCAILWWSSTSRRCSCSRPRARRACARAESGDAPDSRRMKLSTIRSGIATALMLLAIPWPGMRGPAVVPVLTTFSGRENQDRAGCSSLS